METITLQGKVHTIKSVSYNEKMKVCRVHTDKDEFIIHGKAFYPFEVEGVDRMETVKSKLTEKYGN